MQSGVFLYPFDQVHRTAYTKDPQYITTTKSLLGGFCVNNKGGATIYLQVFDSAPTGNAAAKKAVLDAIVATGDYDELPIYAGSYGPAAWAGGLRHHNGLAMRCVTAAAGTTEISGNDAKYHVNYRGCW